MTIAVPNFTGTVTTISADWANTVSQLVYGVFGAASNDAAAINNLGLGTLATQNANLVQIAGGSIDNTPIGFTTPANAKFNTAYIIDTPVSPQHATNKAYVDAQIQAQAGAIATLEELYVAKIGSTMTGPLVLMGDPVLANGAATKHYVDQQITLRLASTVNSYAALRTYNGSATWVEITAPKIAGLFYVDPTDNSSSDNNATVIIDTQNRRWKRVLNGSVEVEWFGAQGDGTAHDEAAFIAAAALQMPIALKSNATYLIGSAITITGGIFILRNRATLKLAPNTIVNSDASSQSFTPLLRLQGMSYVDLGQTVFDHNNGAQTYPATVSQFGRGTQPFLHNGSVEISPDSSGNFSTNINVSGATFINAYINGLVLWQCQNVWLNANQINNTTWHGISMVGVRNVRCYKNRGYMIGQNTAFPASRNYNQRSLISVDYFPQGITTISEGIPCVTTGDFAAGGINRAVEISENFGEKCLVHTVYVRATIGLAGGRNRSYNVGFNYPLAAPNNPTHYDFEFCEGANTENQGYQDTVQGSDIAPSGMVAVAMQGNATAQFPLNGKFQLNVSGARMESSINPSTGASTSLLNVGMMVSSGVIARNSYINGTQTQGAVLQNFSLYETTPAAAHDSSFDGSTLLNIGSSSPILIKFSGTANSSVTNISAENCAVDSGKEPITFDLSLNTGTYPPSNVRYSTGSPDWHTTAENVQNPVNAPFYRQVTNSNSGNGAAAGFAANGDTGQSLVLGVTSSGWNQSPYSATQAFMASSAQNVNGLLVRTLAGPTVFQQGSNTTLQLFASGRTRFGTGSDDGSNQVQLTGLLGVGNYTLATLPVSPAGSPLAYATDGCKQGEATGAGTGALVYYSSGQWRYLYSDQAIGTIGASEQKLYIGGTWDASANHVNGDTNTSLNNSGHQTINTGTVASPTYQSVSANGAIYRVTVAGTTSIDGFAQWDVGDLAACIANQWVKITVNFTNVVFAAGTF